MGFRLVTYLQFKIDDIKNSGDDDGNKYLAKLKRSSGWAKKKETDRQKLKAIAHDKNQQKLNFEFIPSTRPSIEVTDNL